MVLDYSKWDKLDCSSSEDEAPKRRAPAAPTEPDGKDPEIRRLLQLIQQQGGVDGAVDYHPRKSLHKALFDPGNWKRWVDPSLLEAIAPWRRRKESGVGNDFSRVDLDAFEGLKVEAPGIVSFPAFTDEFCQLVLEEVKHYRQAGMPARAPNSMNNYGLILNEVGLRPAFTSILREVFLPIGARLFGDESDRVSRVRGTATGTENWGGSSLDDHHTFVVQYRPSDDKHLDMHIDECDVTFNFGITPSGDFEGNDLTFCGMFDSDAHRKYHHTYRHVKGRCVVHSGKRRHGALDIEKGERASLIMWTKSRAFRRTAEYNRRNRGILNHGPADRVCLSYTHDPDYKALTPKKLQYHMRPKQDGETESQGSTQAPTEKRWVRVCSNAELVEGKAKLLALEAENEQVAVWRHRGEIYALDNRCAHMGGPLCDGDIEDLGAHWKRGDGSRSNGQKSVDGVVKCPRHGMCFNLRTGEHIDGGHMRQRRYPVRLANEGRDIEVEVELEVPQRRPGEDSPDERPGEDASEAAESMEAVTDAVEAKREPEAAADDRPTVDEAVEAKAPIKEQPGIGDPAKATSEMEAEKGANDERPGIGEPTGVEAEAAMDERPSAHVEGANEERPVVGEPAGTAAEAAMDERPGADAEGVKHEQPGAPTAAAVGSRKRPAAMAASWLANNVCRLCTVRRVRRLQ